MRYPKLLMLSVLLCATLPGDASAEMPNYDVDGHCGQVSSFGGSPSQMIKQACYQQEQHAYDGLKPTWDALPSGMQRHCDQVARFGGGGSYMLLAACVDQERAASDSNGQFTFRR
jgi:hypothetical protein